MAAETLHKKRTPSQYHLVRKYDVLSTSTEDNLIMKRKDVNDPIKIILPMEEYYEKLSQIHKDCGRGGCDRMLYALKNKFVIPKPVIEIFVSLCRTCLKKRSQPHKGLVVRPIVSKDLNSRGQVE